MNKNILIGILLLSFCASQAMNQEKQVKTHSLLERYLPSARTAKKIIFAGVLFGLFRGTKTLDYRYKNIALNPSELPTLKECTEKVKTLRAEEDQRDYLMSTLNSHTTQIGGTGYQEWLQLQKIRTHIRQKRKKITKRCFRQLNPKDQKTFFEQLDLVEQSEIFEKFSYTEALEVEKYLKK